jgi:beta-phosphoglucomutase-like phosphatase (HAD superfamily)
VFVSNSLAAAAPTTRPVSTNGRFAPANIKLVIFDCDGVLIDSEPIASSTLAQALNEIGVAITPEEAHVAFTGFSERETRQYLRDKLGVDDLDGLFSLWSRHLYSGFRRLREMQGISDVVAALDCNVCVASNSSLYRLTRSLGRLDLWRIFNGHVFSADMVANPKPAPDLLQLCAREFGVDPAQCVMIDDSPHGVQSAIAAGRSGPRSRWAGCPRPRRAAVLREQGAVFVAEGGAALLQCIIEADALLAEPAR